MSLVPTRRLIPPIPVISRRDRLTISQIPAHSGPAIQSLVDALNRLGVSPINGECIYLYHGCDGNPATFFDLEICLPVPATLTADLPAPLQLLSTSTFQCLAIEYTGPLTGIGAAWMELVAAVRTAGLEPTDESREVYKKWVGFDSPENITELQQGIA